MQTISVKNISKKFGEMKAVADVSFDAVPGEIFGILGPNGAGKTTSIRILLDLFKADSGSVEILGGEMDEAKKNLIGYLPEERGLYQDITLERCIVYLATLKGLSKVEAQSRMEGYLDRFNLTEDRKKKVKELSKGMQQKAQLIVTLIHKPELIIIDEPFSALDPVNTQMVKDLLLEERANGTTIVMCTHQMHQVEELCDRIVLINKGRSVLYGNTNEIRKEFSGQDIDVRVVGELPEDLPDIVDRKALNGGWRLSLAEGSNPQDLLKILVERGIVLEQFEIALPGLDEIFIKVVQGQGAVND